MPTETNEKKTENFETIKILSNNDWMMDTLIELNSKIYSDLFNIDIINEISEETEDYETHSSTRLDSYFYLTSEEMKRRSVEFTEEMKQKIIKEKISKATETIKRP